MRVRMSRPTLSVPRKCFKFAAAGDDFLDLLTNGHGHRAAFLDRFDADDAHFPALDEGLRVLKTDLVRRASGGGLLHNRLQL